MKAEHSSALLALAGRQGQKGLCSVLGKAIEQYLEGERIRARRRRELLSVFRSLPVKDAKDLSRATLFLRENWG